MGAIKLSGPWTAAEIENLKSEYGITIDQTSDLSLEKKDDQVSLRSDDGHHLEFDFDENRVDYHPS